MTAFDLAAVDFARECRHLDEWSARPFLTKAAIRAYFAEFPEELRSALRAQDLENIRTAHGDPTRTGMLVEAAMARHALQALVHQAILVEPEVEKQTPHYVDDGFGDPLTQSRAADAATYNSREGSFL